MNDIQRPDGSETIQPRRKEERRKLRLWIRVVTTALSAGLAFACSDPGYDAPRGSDAFAETANYEDSRDDSAAPSDSPKAAEAEVAEEATHAAAEPSSDRPNALTLSSTSVTQGDVCEGSSVIECKVDLPPQGGVVNCFVGLRVCHGGTWSDCMTEAGVEQILAAEETNVTL